MVQSISRNMQLLNLRQRVLFLIGVVLIVRLIAHVPVFNLAIW
jgi:preprotein translocase subunit SecY